jgi:hypothetical protein
MAGLLHGGVLKRARRLSGRALIGTDGVGLGEERKNSDVREMINMLNYVRQIELRFVQCTTRNGNDHDG